MNNQFSFQHETFPGNILIRWMTQKRKGTIKEFVSTLNYLIFNHLGLEEVHEGKIQEEAMYLLDDLASLLLIEYNEKEWYVSKPCLNLFDGLSNKATITGARSPELYRKLLNSTNIQNYFFIDNSRTFFTNVQKDYLRRNFLPPTILISYKKENLKKICEEFSLELIDTKPIDFLKSLPSISKLVEDVAHGGQIRLDGEIESFVNFKVEINKGEVISSDNSHIKSEFLPVFERALSSDEGYKQGVLHRRRDSKNTWSYFIPFNGEYKSVTKEIGLWYAISNRQKMTSYHSPNYLFYNITDLPNPTVTIPINIKLPRIYSKALNLCSGIIPYLYRPAGDGKFPVFADYYNISREFLDVLTDKLELNSKSTGQRFHNKVYYEYGAQADQYGRSLKNMFTQQVENEVHYPILNHE